jgi:hypothetical protein
VIIWIFKISILIVAAFRAQAGAKDTTPMFQLVEEIMKARKSRSHDHSTLNLYPREHSQGILLKNFHLVLGTEKLQAVNHRH